MQDGVRISLQPLERIGDLARGGRVAFSRQLYPQLGDFSAR
jgi:hypothetical protein